MIRICLAFEHLCGSGCRRTPAVAQTGSAWTQVGMLSCRVNPSIGFIIAGHQTMECQFTQNRFPPQAYEGALNMVGLDIGISRGWFARLGSPRAHRRRARRRSRRRRRRRQRRHRHRSRCRRQRPGRGLRPHLCAATGLARGVDCHQRRARYLCAQAQAGALMQRRRVPDRTRH